MYCSACGASIQEGCNFCPFCGIKIHKNGAPPPPEFKKKKMPIWFKLLLSLAFMALVGVTVAILFQENLRKTVEDQLTTLHAKDVTKAYYLFTSQDFQKATPLETFREFVNDHPAFINNKTFEINTIHTYDDKRTLTGKIKSTDGEVLPVEYQLIKEDGTWKILSIKILAPEFPGSSSK